MKDSPLSDSQRLQDEGERQLSRARRVAGQLAQTEEQVAVVAEAVAATNDRLAAMRGDPKYRERAGQARQRALEAHRMASRERATAQDE